MFVNVYCNPIRQHFPPETELCQLCYDYGSDKCPQIQHFYSPQYYKLLKDYRQSFQNVLEIGIGNAETMQPITARTDGIPYKSGASLRVWKAFFPNAQIFGADIDRNTLFAEERIKCFQTDQSSPASLVATIQEIARSEQKESIQFDLIVDDGSHVIGHQVTTLLTLEPFVKEGGFYIVEDIKNHELPFLPLEVNKLKHVQIFQGPFDYWDCFIAYRKMADGQVTTVLS